jgi:TfoX/Sxy family transcriptional regulator of competence genes
MAWKKASPELIERFDAALPKHQDASPRKMFGYPACFVNGNFFVGLHEENVVLRLPGALKAKFPELAGAHHFDPRNTGKGMKDWWVVPQVIARDATRLAQFFEAAFAEVRQLPPKAPRAARARKKRAS